MTAKQLIQAHIAEEGIADPEPFLREVQRAARVLLAEHKAKSAERWRIAQSENGSFVAYHDCGADAARALGISRQAVHRAIDKQSLVKGKYRLHRYDVEAKPGPVRRSGGTADKDDATYLNECDNLLKHYATRI